MALDDAGLIMILLNGMLHIWFAFGKPLLDFSLAILGIVAEQPLRSGEGWQVVHDIHCDILRWLAWLGGHALHQFTVILKCCVREILLVALRRWYRKDTCTSGAVAVQQNSTLLELALRKNTIRALHGSTISL